MSDTTPPKQTDFAPAEIATTVNKHDEDFILVKGRLDEIEKKFGNNEKIADTLCETAEKASRMNEMLSKSFIKLLQHDTNVKSAVEKLIDTTDRKAVNAAFKKYGGIVGGLVWTVLVLILGAWLGHIWK